MESMVRRRIKAEKWNRDIPPKVRSTHYAQQNSMKDKGSGFVVRMNEGMIAMLG